MSSQVLLVNKKLRLKFFILVAIIISKQIIAS